MGEPPCQPDGTPLVQCNKCGKKFMNAQCLERHKGTVCAKFRRCLDCGVIWDFGRFLKGERPEHVCGESFCQTCKVFHDPERGCFIGNLPHPRPPPPTGAGFSECEDEDDDFDDEENEDVEDVDETSTIVTSQLANEGGPSSQKEQKGNLQIKLYSDENSLCCKIIDDGIGRKRAADLKSKSASSHKSLGMRITADRIEMLRHNSQVQTSITINDLVLPNGTAAGTEVLLKIPILYD